MTTRNLDALFQPSAIALIGASERPGSVGRVLAGNLMDGGFAGRIMLVNPKTSMIAGAPCYPSVEALPVRPDLAVIATPAASVPDLITALAAKQCRAAIVISAGFDAALRQQMLDAARPTLMRIVGPNCLGVLSTPAGINSSFAHLPPDPGGLALLTQSGAIATSMIDWGKGHGVGFSHILSIGDMSDADFGDFLDYLALDPATSAILLYIETITSARKFMSAARIAARAKPVIAVKGGRSTSGARAAASHTGAMAGADAIYSAALKRAGVLRVDSLRSLFDAAETLSRNVRIEGERLAIVTNGGGLGVVAADALDAGGGVLADLSAATVRALDRTLPSAWSRGNPVDILGDAQGDRYTATLEALARDPGVDAVLVMNCPTGVADTLEAARTVHRARSRAAAKPMIACWMGAASVAEPRRILSQGGIPEYDTPEEAVSAFLHLAEHRRNQAALMEVPPPREVRDTDRVRSRRIIDTVLSEGRSLLTEPEAKDLLAAYGVPVAPTRSAASPAEAAVIAREMSGPFALKILSRDITHKTDVGGVRLNLEEAADVETAALDMLHRISRNRPDARIDGFTVQPMIRRPHAQELILGAAVDPTFGPCLMFGHGGVAAEVLADRVFGLPPLNVPLALDMIRRTRIARLLAGFRDRKPADLRAIAAVLTSLSDLVVDHPDIQEIDINPLLADTDGVVALDARVAVARAAGDPAKRLAIRPWPAELVREIEVAGAPITVRPIRPDDDAALAALTQDRWPDNLRLRFHGAVRTLDTATAARLSQIDYDREMVLAAVDPAGAFAGVVRLVFDPAFEQGECALIVRTDRQHQGLGAALLRKMLDYARSRGAHTVWGDVLNENREMLQLAQQLGADLRLLEGITTHTRAVFRLA
jgi:acetyltransferase